MLAFVILYLLMHYGVARPIKRLARQAQLISVAKPVALDVTGIPHRSRNELGELALAIVRLRTSMALAISRMKQNR